MAESYKLHVSVDREVTDTIRSAYGHGAPTLIARSALEAAAAMVRQNIPFQPATIGKRFSHAMSGKGSADE